MRAQLHAVVCRIAAIHGIVHRPLVAGALLGRWAQACAFSSALTPSRTALYAVRCDRLEPRCAQTAGPARRTVVIFARASAAPRSAQIELAQATSGENCRDRCLNEAGGGSACFRLSGCLRRPRTILAAMRVQIDDLDPTAAWSGPSFS